MLGCFKAKGDWQISGFLKLNGLFGAWNVFCFFSLVKRKWMSQSFVLGLFFFPRLLWRPTHISIFFFLERLKGLYMFPYFIPRILWRTTLVSICFSQVALEANTCFHFFLGWFTGLHMFPIFFHRKAKRPIHVVGCFVGLHFLAIFFPRMVQSPTLVSILFFLGCFLGLHLFPNFFPRMLQRPTKFSNEMS